MNHNRLLHKLLIALLPLGIAGSAMATTIPGSVLSVLPRSQAVGIASQSDSVFVTVSLKPRFPAELQAYVNSVSDPRSSTYRQWLTPAQVAAQFGPSPSTVSSVVNYLRSKGFTITLQARNNMGIIAHGTIAQVQSAFSTTVKTYTGPDPLGNTISFRANSTLLSAPATWAPQVQAVSGIDTWTRPHPWAQTQTLTPPLMRGCYNTAPAFALGFKGQGVTIGESNFDGFSLSNAPLYITAYNLPVPSGGPGSNIRVITVGTGAQNNPPGGEGDLDFQMELANAPLANILIYDGSDEIAVLTQESSDNLADAISESYGFNLGSGGATAAHNLHLAMEAQGQTIMNATGDSGTAIQAFPYPDCDPEALGVGGAIATVDSTSGVMSAEQNWNGGGGGWTQSGFPIDVRPSWQHGPGIPNQPNFRLQPDVALQGDGAPNGATIIYISGQQSGISGTSVASPLNCGLLGIVEQRLLAAGLPSRLGRMNDLIYMQAGQVGGWFDITQGPGNGTLPDGTASNPHVGWDFCTGWGSPDYDAFYNSFVQTVSATPYFPDSISTALGTYIIGDPASVATSDGIYYQIGSTGIPLFGQAAGATVSFTIPQNSIAIDIDLQTNSGGEDAGTNMVWLMNQFTGNWDLIGSVPMKVSGSQDQKIHVRAADVPLYIGGGGEVDMFIRGHVPIRPFNNQQPVPFTYKLDLLSLLVR